MTEVRATVRRATFVLGAAHLVNIGASLVTLKLVSAALGPGGYGQYSAVLATYVLLGSLTDLGTGTVAVRE
ncbi:oligosaccharide flippase family protein, partial [bacterium]|nr:oligosaccharide flippase family protein [bacterium]